jgi:hypothetical protein
MVEPGLGQSSGDQASLKDASVEQLIGELQADRLWLLRQIDSGRWSEWRLDLAALERELGQLLDQVEQRSATT